jgi:hypothetical protein
VVLELLSLWLSLVVALVVEATLLVDTLLVVVVLVVWFTTLLTCQVALHTQ